jgi:hypothetical protein
MPLVPQVGVLFYEFRAATSDDDLHEDVSAVDNDD